MIKEGVRERDSVNCVARIDRLKKRSRGNFVISFRMILKIHSIDPCQAEAEDRR